MRHLFIVTLLLFSSSLSAETTAKVTQSHEGKVLAKLDLSNIQNSYILNSAVGNAAVISNNSHKVQLYQSNMGDITSELSVSNILGQVVEQNVAGTLAVIN